MPVDLPIKDEETKGEWTVTGRFVLVTIVLFFLVVASVNALMMTLAIRTFPGADAKNGYDKSQNYNREIAASRAQHGRGWTSDITLARKGNVAHLAFEQFSKDGQPVPGLRIEAELLHPTHKNRDVRLNLVEIRPGFYEAAAGLLATGVWGIEISAHSATGERVYFVRSRATLG